MLIPAAPMGDIMLSLFEIREIRFKSKFSMHQ